MWEIENHALSIIQHITAFFTVQLFTFQMLKAGNKNCFYFPSKGSEWHTLYFPWENRLFWKEDPYFDCLDWILLSRKTGKNECPIIQIMIPDKLRTTIDFLTPLPKRHLPNFYWISRRNPKLMFWNAKWKKKKNYAKKSKRSFFNACTVGSVSSFGDQLSVGKTKCTMESLLHSPVWGSASVVSLTRYLH
jgi:hypothetical protein